MDIYEFTFEEGQTDWVFAPTKKEAIEFYQNHTGEVKMLFAAIAKMIITPSL